MGRIRAIVFDAGGVLQLGSGRHFLQQVEKNLGLKPLQDKIGLAVFDERMNKGEISVREMLKNMFPNASKEQEKKMLLLWEQEWPTNWKMIELAKRLGKKYTVSMLSNSDAVHEERMKKEHVLELFESPVLSHKAGLIKPDKRIFELALKKLELKPEECVFIDDARENVETAKKLGFKAFVFKSQQQCERELKKMGVEA